MPRKKKQKPDYPAVEPPSPLEVAPLAEPLEQLRQRIPNLITASELPDAPPEPLPRREPPWSFEVEKDYPQSGIRILLNRRDNQIAVMFDDDKAPSRAEKDRMEFQAHLRYDPYRHQWQGDYGSFTTRMAVRRLAREFDKERSGGRGVGM